MTNKISIGFDFVEILFRISNRKFNIFSISALFCLSALIYETYKPTKFSGVYELTITIDQPESKTAILNNLLEAFGSHYHISNDTLAKLFINEFSSMRQHRKGTQASVNQISQTLQIEYNNSVIQAPLLDLQELIKRTEMQINKIIYEDIYRIWDVGFLLYDTRSKQIISYAEDFNDNKHDDFYRLILSENPSNLTQTRFSWEFILLSTVIGFLIGSLITLILIDLELKEKL